MWKAQAGHTLNTPLVNRIMAENSNDPDDWDTDPDFVVRIHSLYSHFRVESNLLTRCYHIDLFLDRSGRTSRIKTRFQINDFNIMR